ncbi:MAG: hypothetical protein U0Q16_36310 [Bryobacteraceae bacterium]
MLEPITIVSGLPRSGTSLMMQMLVAGGMAPLTDNLRQPDTDNPRGYFEFEPVKATHRDSSWVAQAPGKVVKVIHTLLTGLPSGFEYHVVFMRRPMEEVLRSQAAMLARSGKTGANLDPAVLGALFEKQLEQVEAWLAARSNFRLMNVPFHDCLFDPHVVAANVNRFLGGTLNESAMAAATDANLYRQRQSR